MEEEEDDEDDDDEDTSVDEKTAMLYEKNAVDRCCLSSCVVCQSVIFLLYSFQCKTQQNDTFTYIIIIIIIIIRKFITRT